MRWGCPVSPSARRYFGCVLPLLLCVFGCATSLLLGYASQAFVQYEAVRDDSMTPLLERGWQVVISNMSYWSVDPRRGQVVTVRLPDGWAMRRVVGVPGETVEVRDGRVWVDGRERDPAAGAVAGVDEPAVRLGADEYFVLPDNRALATAPGRGVVARDAIIGQVVFKVAPDRTFSEIVPLPTPTTVGPP